MIFLKEEISSRELILQSIFWEHKKNIANQSYQEIDQPYQEQINLINQYFQDYQFNRKDIRSYGQICIGDHNEVEKTNYLGLNDGNLSYFLETRVIFHLTNQKRYKFVKRQFHLGFPPTFAPSIHPSSDPSIHPSSYLSSTPTIHPSFFLIIHPSFCPKSAPTTHSSSSTT